MLYLYGDGLQDAKGHGANTGGGLTRDVCVCRCVCVCVSSYKKGTDKDAKMCVLALISTGTD